MILSYYTWESSEWSFSAGDLPKQVKVKKLAKLKTLDTKTGTQQGFAVILYAELHKHFGERVCVFFKINFLK